MAMSHEARELVLYAENDSGMWNMCKSYLDNMKRRMKAGTYDVDLGIKLWTYYATRAAQHYAREHGSMSSSWSRMFPTKVRREAAEAFEERARRELREAGVKAGSARESFRDPGKRGAWALVSIDEDGERSTVDIFRDKTQAQARMKRLKKSHPYARYSIEKAKATKERMFETRVLRARDLGKQVRRYHVVVINEKTGRKVAMTRSNEPVTHRQGVAIMSKLTKYPWRRIQLEEA